MYQCFDTENSVNEASMSLPKDVSNNFIKTRFSLRDRIKKFSYH